MIGTARQCNICGDQFTYRSPGISLMSAVGLYLFLTDFKQHTRSCQMKSSGLNEAGLYYMGLQNKVNA